MIKVGVLRGGPSAEYEISLKTGQSVLDNLSNDFEATDVLIDKKGNWFINGLPIQPEKAVRKFDICFNCLHGAYGEGRLQQLLDSLNVPYTGSGAVPSALSLNKFLSKRTFVINEFKVPEHEALKVSPNLEKELSKIFHTWLMPVVAKPYNMGSSLGVSTAYSLPELKKAVSNAFNYAPEIMVEEFIKGKSASCGVLENFRGEDLYALLPIDANGQMRFSKEEIEEMQGLAKLAHQILGLRHYSSSDFIVSPNGIYILETDSLPALNNSLYSKSLEAIGSNLKEFGGHVIGLAL